MLRSGNSAAAIIVSTYDAVGDSIHTLLIALQFGSLAIDCDMLCSCSPAFEPFICSVSMDCSSIFRDQH